MVLPRSLPTLLCLALVLQASHGLGASGPLGGHLMVAPTRVVLEGRTRSMEVLVINGGKETATFRISIQNLQMDEEGQTRTLEGPGASSAEQLIRFSPRQVRLAPGASQSVRIQVRKPEGLAAGEYRSHMLFQAVPPAGRNAAGPALEEGRIAIDIQAVFGISIPVIVRHGVIRATASLAPPVLGGTPSQPRVDLWLHREGNASIHGDLVATWHAAGRKALPVGRANAIALYAECSRRRLSLDLNPPGGTPFRGGVLAVAFLEHGGTRVLAETRLALP